MIYLYIAIGVLAFLIFLYFFMIMPSIRKNDTVEKIGIAIFAHRGLHDKERHIPENSLAAFERAIQLGVGIELDVHLTADNGTVIMHDTTTDRMTGVSGNVTEMTQAKLARLRLNGTNETIPFLSDVLHLVDGSVPLLIELKSDGGNYASLCKECFKLLDNYKGCYVIESFDPRILFWIRRNRPNVGRGQLATHDSNKSPFFTFLLSNLMLNFLSRPHFFAYDIRYINKSLAPNLCKKLFGSKLYIWTVTDKCELKHNLENGNSSIFEGFEP